jgi:hypothetical protein
MTSGCAMLFWAVLSEIYKITSKLRPLTTDPRVVVFVRFYCTWSRANAYYEWAMLKQYITKPQYSFLTVSTWRFIPHCCL